jgi:hypothetical protein
MLKLLKTTAAVISAVVLCSPLAVAEDSAELPAVPTGLLVLADGSHGVSLSWSDSSAAEKGFYILRSGDGVHWDKIDTVRHNAQSYIDTGLDAESRYIYKVAAFNQNGEVAGFSSLESVVTAPDTAMEVEIQVAGMLAR